MPTWPAKTNYATGDVLTAAQMQDIGNALNSLQSAQYAAGKQKIINGDFNINQRAFTSTTTSATYGFDRWSQTIAGDGTATYSAQTFTAGTAPVAGYEGKNFARFVTTGQTSAAVRTNWIQSIEGVRTLAGQTATVSFWAKAASGTPQMSVELTQYFGAVGSPSSTVIIDGGRVTLSTSWARYSVTVSIPSISGKTIGTDGNDSLGLLLWVSAGSNFASRTGTLGIQNNTFDIWGVQVEAGNTATAFQTATGTLAGELAACQRYYQRITSTGDASMRFGTGFVDTTTGMELTIPFLVQMRTRPTALETTGTAADYIIRHSAGTNTTCNVVPSFNKSNEFAISVNAGAASGLTAGQGAALRVAVTTAYLGWSAEL